jgi:hypothetical protein
MEKKFQEKAKSSHIRGAAPFSRATAPSHSPLSMLSEFLRNPAYFGTQFSHSHAIGGGSETRHFAQLEQKKTKSISRVDNFLYF